jgi:hypothetical protein
MKPVAVGFVLALTLLFPALAFAQPAASDPAALAVLAQAKTAAGGAALDQPRMFHERGTMVRDGKTGAYETWGDLTILRSAGTQTFGGKVTHGGFDGEAAWRMGAHGKITRVTDPAVVRGERLGAWLTVSGYLYPDRFPATYRYLGRRMLDGRALDVISATPQDAQGVDLWFDASTHRLSHIEMNLPGEIVTGDVGDYRLVDGTWIGFALKIVDNGNAVQLALTGFVYEPLDEGKVTPPADKAAR